MVNFLGDIKECKGEKKYDKNWLRSSGSSF